MFGMKSLSSRVKLHNGVEMPILAWASEMRMGTNQKIQSDSAAETWLSLLIPLQPLQRRRGRGRALRQAMCQGRIYYN